MIIDKWNTLCKTKRNLEHELSNNKLAIASIEGDLNDVQQQLSELRPLMPKDSIEFIYEQGYGQINLGKQLGVFYAPENEIRNCPPGWLFVSAQEVKNANDLQCIVDDYKKDIISKFK